MFRTIGQLLPDRLNRLKISRTVEASAVCRAADSALGKTFDHGIPMRAVSFKHGTLNIAVISPAWSHEVSAASEEILRRTNQELGKEIVKYLKTRVSPDLARGEDA